MSSFFLTRAEKKKKQHKKNKFHQMIYELVRLRREEDTRLKEELTIREKNLPAQAKQEDDLVWSAKVGEVRNRLTGQKRAAKERWNRFAGTGDAGGRGL